MLDTQSKVISISGFNTYFYEVGTFSDPSDTPIPADKQNEYAESHIGISFCLSLDHLALSETSTASDTALVDANAVVAETSFTL